MKIILKKKRTNTLEEARTFQDATTNLGKFKKKLVNTLSGLGKEQPEQLANDIINNLKNSIPEKYKFEGKEYLLPDGERVAVFDWIKNLTINNINNLVEMLSEDKLNDNIQQAIAHFILSKKFTGVNSVAELEDLIQLDGVRSDAWWKWKETEKKKREKESLRSSDQNIEQLISPNQNWEILIPHDKQAAIYLGQMCRSNWCTAARSEDNMFSTYHKEDDPLFVLRNKVGKETAEVKNPQTHQKEEISVPIMFQVHFGTQQFKDRKDDEIENDGIVSNLLKLIKNSKTADGKPVEEKYPVVNKISVSVTEKGIEKKVIDERGTITWYLNGEIHREDGPAKEYFNGNKDWYINGKLHRDDGPAKELADGTTRWYRHGVIHRDNGPAFEDPNGVKAWYKNGELHREDGPAYIKSSGSRNWYLNGELIDSSYPDDPPYTPKGWVEKGGKEWDWQNDPWFDKSKIKTELKEHFQRFRKLWL